MKRIKITLALLVCAVAIFFACRKSDINSPSGSSTPTIVDSKTLNDNPRNSEGQDQIKENLESFAEIDFSNTPMPQTEQQAASLLSTLQENSTFKIKNNLGLTNADLVEVFGSLDNPGIADFGAVLTALETVEISPIDPWNICNQQNIYVKCLLETLLPCDAIKAIKKMIDEGNAGAGGAISAGAFYTAWSAYTAAERKIILKGIVQVLGKTGGGFIAVAAVMYEFTVCVVNNGSEIGGSSGTLVEIGVLSKLLPTPLPSSLYYMATEEDAMNFGQFPAFATTIFFNSTDNKYYNDSSYTTLVPDGYYDSEVLTTNLNRQLHHIENGVAVAVYELVPN
jgi:hypothetical protein